MREFYSMPFCPNFVKYILIPRHTMQILQYRNIYKIFNNDLKDSQKTYPIPINKDSRKAE